MQFYILTDLEGVAGVDSFEQTRTNDEEKKGPGMDQLAREVNACAEGIRSVHPDATIDVWDGHGTGGLRKDDVEGATYLEEGGSHYDLEEYDAMLFVGQHAMAGTPFAPLRHTYSSLRVSYFRLNGSFVGEFGCRTLLAAEQGVPTIFLAGDDKACLEAQCIVPEIETAAVKQGTGVESAVHLDPADACDVVRSGAIQAIRRIDEIPPTPGFEPPYTLEIRNQEPIGDERTEPSYVRRIDEYTIQIEAPDITTLLQRR